MNVEQAAETAKKKLSQALKKKANATAEICKEKDGWTAVVEIVEEEHIPSKFDLIGLYEVKLDGAGMLLGWTKRESRSRG